jgi:hypothetical protein
MSLTVMDSPFCVARRVIAQRNGENTVRIAGRALSGTPSATGTAGVVPGQRHPVGGHHSHLQCFDLDALRQRERRARTDTDLALGIRTRGDIRTIGGRDTGRRTGRDSGRRAAPRARPVGGRRPGGDALTRRSTSDCDRERGDHSPAPHRSSMFAVEDRDQDPDGGTTRVRMCRIHLPSW